MKYRIKKRLVYTEFLVGYDAFKYSVQVKKWYGWVTIKEFFDILDEEFARLEADELLEFLNQ